MRISLIAVGAVVFLTMLLARLPMGLVVENARLPLSYESVTGTLWNGEIRGLTVDGQRIGDARIALRFLPLLTGKAEANVTVAGPGLNGSGNVRAMSSLFVLSDAEGTMELSRFGLVDVFGQTLRGDLEADIERVAFGKDGCREAELFVRTDAVTQSLGVFARGGLPLEGQGRCDGPDLLIPMQGSNEDASVVAELRLQPNGRYRSKLSVTPARRELGRFLERAGFRREGDAYVAERSGLVESTL
ncbi:type II secretion system protein N [Parvularcula lutaonensis]|uniref:Type II secretion system protein N n=1 Tax=Parvularcula lutaonensis TaxID=491923 RepID=A0ABV7MDB0_9PROT|nr:type II secretion system protein N [Parvularcula lutaonensis]GGY52757.1 hypothetical protein GCM10007148_22480 [Parvularcula lutaonensis]